MTDSRDTDPAAAHVRSVLWDWDPIGVRAISAAWPSSEYDDLVAPLVNALEHQPALDELASDLHELVTVQYGLPSPHGCKNAAAALLRLPRAA